MNKEAEMLEALVGGLPQNAEMQEEKTEEQSEEIGAKDDPVAEEPDNTGSGSPDEPVDDDEEIVTLASLAADLEIKPEQLYGMRVPVAEGEEPMTIGEMKDNLNELRQKQVADDTTQTELAERQAELAAKEAQLYAQLENVNPAELVKAQAAVSAAEQAYAQIDWTRLEATNPGEAALQRQKLQEQWQIATYNANQIQERMDKTREEISSQREQASKQQMAIAMQQLHSLIPDWRDEPTYLREREHMVNKLVAAGVNEQAIRAQGDPTLIKWMYDQINLGTRLEEAAPKVKAPKVLKASAVRESGRGKKQAQKRFIDNAIKSKDSRVKNEAMTMILTQALGRS